MEPKIVEIVAAISRIIRILSLTASNMISNIFLILGILLMFLPYLLALYSMSLGDPSIPLYIYKLLFSIQKSVI